MDTRWSYKKLISVNASCISLACS